MSEKNRAENEARKERFEFVFAINDNVICQRYFRINGFNECSVYSKNFLETFRNCVNLIKDDLAVKSRLYLWYTAPQVFESKEEMKKHIQMDKEGKISLKLKTPSYILTRNDEQVYLYNDGEVTPYNEYFNKSDYIKTSQGVDNTPYQFKFSFLEDGKEVMSEIWSDYGYPRFVRTNIDLSNSKNKYKTDASYMPFEAILIKIFNDSQMDIIPIIVREICSVCSYPERKKYVLTNNGYATNPFQYNFDYIKKWEEACKGKTNKYFKNLGA